jgi:putative PIN family toxin of toxin-antitoxin system
MVYLQGAARKEGPAGGCLGLFEREEIDLFVSPEILSEVDDVLRRPKLRRKFPALTHEAVNAFLEDLRSRASLILEIPKVFEYPRDPKDEPYLNLAIAAEARYLVSFDNDLLDLMDDPDFRQRFPQLTILDPPAFLRALASS